MKIWKDSNIVFLLKQRLPSPLMVTLCLSFMQSQHKVQAGEKPSAHAATWLFKRRGEDLYKNNMPIWVFPKIVVPQNGWFIMEIPIRMDDLGVPLFSETSIWSIAFCQLITLESKKIAPTRSCLGPFWSSNLGIFVNQGPCECDCIEKCYGWGDPEDENWRVKWAVV